MNAAIDLMLDEAPEDAASAWDPGEPQPAPSKRAARRTYEGTGDPLCVRGVVIELKPERPTTSRDQARSARKHDVRGVTLRARDLAVERRRHLRLVGDDELPRRLPATRADCVDGPRPCPYVSCRHHLYLDVTQFDGVKLTFPDLEPDEIPYTCSLDVAEAGGATLEQAGALLNVTRERIRQLEVRAFKTLRRRLRLAGVEPGIDPEDRDDHEVAW